MKTIQEISKRIAELEKIKTSLKNKDYSKFNLEETKEKEIRRITIMISTLKWVLY